jgi:hypothetical protein
LAYHRHKLFRIPLEKFNDTIEAFCKNVHFDEGFVSDFKKIVINEWERRKTSTQEEATYSEGHISELKAKSQMLSETIKKLASQTVITKFERELEEVELELANARDSRNKNEHKEADIQTLINYAKYYMEHLAELLLGSSNPHQNTAMFGLLFTGAPNYQELLDGTPQLAPIFKLNDAYKTSKSLSVTPLGLEPRFRE